MAEDASSSHDDEAAGRRLSDDCWTAPEETAKKEESAVQQARRTAPPPTRRQRAGPGLPGRRGEKATYWGWFDLWGRLCKFVIQERDVYDRQDSFSAWVGVVGLV